ncbi:MAG: hypothetical protein KJ899_15220 [Gammaproteobacteria bacterium]|nr:hypothetical protein [Gammaproteobacteria bacterium]
MTFTINSNIIEIKDPSFINFSVLPTDSFLRNTYVYLYGLLNPSSSLFQIDFDSIIGDINNFISIEDPRLKINKLNANRISASEWTKNPAQKALVLFFTIFPDFNLFVKNINTDVEINILNAETLTSQTTNTANFLNIKIKIDEINRNNWSRIQTVPEKNSGVSILGSISEKLLEIALDSLIDNKNFFRSTNYEVQSYGDFVLMCLPNNLWISVKSNFARERLLASGFTTDIIGVGYFTDFSEFTSRTKIRNFIKVGFLAMYLPNVPITEEQMTSSSSTYDEIVSFYGSVDNIPKNINGKPFIRSLSNLHSDLSGLLSEYDLKKRTTMSY